MCFFRVSLLITSMVLMNTLWVRAFIISNDSPCLTLEIEKTERNHRGVLEIPPHGLKIVPETDENRAATFTIRFKPSAGQEKKTGESAGGAQKSTGKEREHSNAAQ